MHPAQKRSLTIVSTAILVVILAFLSIIASIPATRHTITVKPATPPDYKAINYNDHAIHIELYVYKNNQLIYYDPDDPATNNFLGLIAELIAGDVLDQNNNIVKSPDQSGLYRIADTNYPGYMFINYDSGYTYSNSLYLLPSNYDYGQISNGGVTFDTNAKSVTLSASINIQTTTTAYGVGLYTELYAGNGVGTAVRRYVLFYDPFDNPINVTAGDVITVVYKISVP